VLEEHVLPVEQEGLFEALAGVVLLYVGDGTLGLGMPSVTHQGE
jgi:hypothetical protein